jgi:hypothetical protein
MTVELAAVDASILGPTRGKVLGLGDPPLSPFGKFSLAVSEPSQDNFVLELEGAPPTAVAFSFFSNSAAATPTTPNQLASHGVECTDSGGVDLSSDGLLPSPCVGSETPLGSPFSCSTDPTLSPRSVMDMFPVSLSGSLGAVDSQQLDVGTTAPQGSTGFADFQSSCRRPISPVLPRPST